MVSKLEVMDLESGGTVTMKGRDGCGRWQKESIEIITMQSDRFHSVVREERIKMAVVARLGDLEDLGPVNKNKRIREKGKEERSRMWHV